MNGCMTPSEDFESWWAEFGSKILTEQERPAARIGYIAGQISGIEFSIRSAAKHLAPKEEAR